MEHYNSMFGNVYLELVNNGKCCWDWCDSSKQFENHLGYLLQAQRIFKFEICKGPCSPHRSDFIALSLIENVASMCLVLWICEILRILYVRFLGTCFSSLLPSDVSISQQFYFQLLNRNLQTSCVVRKLLLQKLSLSFVFMVFKNSASIALSFSLIWIYIYVWIVVHTPSCPVLGKSYRLQPSNRPAGMRILRRKMSQ